LKIVQPETGIIINATEDSAAKHKCNQLKFDLREKQQEIDGNRIKVYQCGEKLFAKIDGNCEDECGENMKGMMQSKLKFIMQWKFNLKLFYKETATVT
jgi:hypothetical protein